MKIKKFRPKFDKLFFTTMIPTLIILIAATVLSAVSLTTILIMLAVDIFTLYFFVSPFFGYVELRDESVFIKFGFIQKSEIPYRKITDVTKARKIYSDSLVALKNSLDHINIKYNKFDIVSVSVEDNDAFSEELKSRVKSGVTNA